MEDSEKRRIVEALILSSAEPISAAKLAEIIPYCDPGQAKDLVNELNTEYVEQDRSFEIWEVAGGYQIRTRAEFSGYLQKLQKERALRLSQAALETLAIIAYRQPTTRAEIEDVRGVDAGATVKSLLERQLIRIAGQREVPGRPMLYGTTRRFLEVFGLERLKDLPTLRELDEIAREQGLMEKAEKGASDEPESGAGSESESADATPDEAGEVVELDRGEPSAPSDEGPSDAGPEAQEGQTEPLADEALLDEALTQQGLSQETSDDGVEDSSPVVEDSLPVVEDSSPVVEDSLPVVEDSLPVEDSSPVVEDSPTPFESRESEAATAATADRPEVQDAQGDDPRDPN